MAAMNFPDSPLGGDTFTVGDKTWVYSGGKWITQASEGGVVGDITLGTGTTGAYVASLVAGTGITLTNNSGEGATPTVAIGQSVATSTTPTFAGLTLNGNITFEGATADDYETIIAITDPTSDRVIVFPDLTGTVVTTGDTGSITSLMIADGTIVNADVNASAAIAHSKLANATAGQVLLGTTSTGVVTATTISGDITIDGAGVASIASNSVALGTDTTGNYVASLVAGTGVTLTNGTASEGGTPTVAIGQAVGTASNVQFNDVTVDGNLTVNGTTTTLNTETLAIEDNIVVLNSNVTGSPTTNAGIEVERGTSANVLVRWNETTDKWEFTNDGSVYTALGGSVAISDTAPSSPVQGAVWFESDTLKTFVYYDSSWVEIGVTAGVAVLNDLTDVTVPSPTTNDVLQWNGTAWVNVAASTVGATTLDGLSDAVVTSPLQFQGLMYDGTNWVNSNIPDVYLVRNNTASTILKGTLVGAVGAEPSGRIDVAPFQVTGTENSELRAMGIATSNISSGVNGEVMSFGTLTGLDTRGSTASALAVGDETWAAGDILFAHPTVDGKLTNVRPQHDLAVAFITVRHASSGQIAIRIIPGNNHLEWMHDVSLVDKTSGDFLKYNGTLWVNDPINLGTDTTGNYVSDVTASTGITVTHTPGEGSSASIALNATLDDLSNVSVASPSSGQFLKWNGTAWVPATIIGGATISDTAPASPAAGQLWFDSTVGKTFVYYDSQWIEVGGVGTGARMVSSSSAPASPLEGSMWFDTDTAQTFVYYDSSWIEIGASGVTASVQDSAPASPVSGQIWFNSLTGGTYVYYGTNWIEVGASPFSALVNTINAKGDLLVGTADNTVGGLGVGSANQVLTVDSSTATGLKWATPVSTGKAIAMSIVFSG